MADATMGRLPVLAEVGAEDDGAARLARRAMFVALGVAALTLAAKAQVPLWPVPMTMGTFAVLAIGAAYGPGLGLATIGAYLGLGLLGADVFAGSTATENGIAYMLGGTGGYLVGYVLATALLGVLARRGWDRSAPRMAGAMLLGNAVIYVPGLLWLLALHGPSQPILAWGLWPFLLGDAIKLGLAALLFPVAWRALGPARS